jgi:CBS domain-containing protein
MVLYHMADQGVTTRSPRGASLVDALLRNPLPSSALIWYTSLVTDDHVGATTPTPPVSTRGRMRTQGWATTEARVSEYMTEEVRSVRWDATLKEAGKLLQKYKIGLLFVDDDRRYVGVITESGLSRNAVAKGLDPNTTLVKAVMSRKIVSIEDNEPIVEAVKLMKEHGIRHLAVTKNETVVGIISISDIVRYYSGVE